MLKCIIIACLFHLLAGLAVADTIISKMQKKENESIAYENVIVYKSISLDEKADQALLTRVDFYSWISGKKVLQNNFRVLHKPHMEYYRVEYSPDEQRQKILTGILSQSVHARITKRDGTREVIYCAGIESKRTDRSLLYGGWPTESFILMKAHGTEKEEMVSLADALSLEIVESEDIRLKIKNGNVKAGQVIHEYGKEKYGAWSICGVAPDWKPLSVEADEIKKVEFFLADTMVELTPTSDKNKLLN